MSEKLMIQTALKNVLPSLEDIPPEVGETAQNFVLQSRHKISTLKPDEEPARHVLCVHLAVEKYSDKLSLPIPNTRAAPVPLKTYNKLLTIFRKELMSQQSQSNQPSPVKTPSKNRVVQLQATPTPSPTKRKIISTNASPAATPSPSKRQRGGPKSTDPRAEDIELVCSRLGVGIDALDAIAYGYKQYNNLVKDRWGLLCGLIYVVATKAQPELDNAKIPFTKKISHSVPHANIDKVDEWVIWAEKIVGDQSWVRQIAAPGVNNRKSNMGTKHSSGIGNMITGAFCFTNPKKIENYKAWRAEVYSSIADQ